MTGAAGRVAALAAVFAPERAPALASRLSGPAAAEAVRQAARIAGAPRRERLQALSTAISFPADPQRVGSAADRERPRIAKVLREVADGVVDGRVSPLVVRLCRERLGR